MTRKQKLIKEMQKMEKIVKKSYDKMFLSRNRYVQKGSRDFQREYREDILFKTGKYSKSGLTSAKRAERMNIRQIEERITRLNMFNERSYKIKDLIKRGKTIERLEREGFDPDADDMDDVMNDIERLFGDIERIASDFIGKIATETRHADRFDLMLDVVTKWFSAMGSKFRDDKRVKSHKIYNKLDSDYFNYEYEE